MSASLNYPTSLSEPLVHNYVPTSVNGGLGVAGGGGGGVGATVYLNSSSSNPSTTTSSSSNTMTANKNLAQQIVELIRRLNIRLVAFDFDYTIVTIHTGGQWLDSPEKLAEFVRPCFRELLPVLLKASDLHVCVVTYSPQERLIREVLRISLKDEQDINEMLSKVVIKGNTKEFLERHGPELCFANGKQIHIDYCRSQIQQINVNTAAAANDLIDNSSVLLIDDDVQNIRTARMSNQHAFQVESNVKLIDLYNFLKERVETYIY